MVSGAGTLNCSTNLSTSSRRHSLSLRVSRMSLVVARNSFTAAVRLVMTSVCSRAEAGGSTMLPSVCSSERKWGGVVNTSCDEEGLGDNE